jgi:APA family basic amino acid/polyamine antiporter
VPGYPVTPVLFVAASAAIVLNTLFTQPGRAFLGLTVVLAGVPAYLVWRRRAAARNGSGLAGVVPEDR